MTALSKDSASGLKIHQNKEGLSFEASEIALQKVVDFLDHALNWSSDNPILFVIFLMFLFLCFREFLGNKRDMAAMRAEYNQTRETNKQPKLPLP